LQWKDTPRAKEFADRRQRHERTIERLENERKKLTEKAAEIVEKINSSRSPRPDLALQGQRRELHDRIVSLDAAIEGERFDARQADDRSTVFQAAWNLGVKDTYVKVDSMKAALEVVNRNLAVALRDEKFATAGAMQARAKELAEGIEGLWRQWSNITGLAHEA
jgi:chromosome segregation ATPase